MFFPESLYLLSARDQQVTWLDPVLVGQVDASAAVTIVRDFQVQEGRALILTHAGLALDPGAGQNVVEGFIFVLRPTLLPACRLVWEPNALGANVNAFRSWQGHIVVPPGWLVRATGTFNAGIANNGMELSLAGMLIPIGNVQRV